MLTIDQQVQAALGYVQARLADAQVAPDPAFEDRLQTYFPRLLTRFTELYGEHEHCLDQLGALLVVAARSWADRPDELKRVDALREAQPDWFLDNRVVGGVCSVERYAGDLEGIRARIPYLRELGLTYLHLMPLFAAPERDSDGGYAVSSYREVDPAQGDMAGLRALAHDLRAVGISLVLDFVFNHTADEHVWARQALAKDPEYEGYYWIFPDRTMPDAFERTTREVLPDDHRGSFIPLPDGRWVWSTFHSFEWDLNYSNPAVFTAMAGEMLFLANLGIDVLRLDAVAFVWKQLGTSCESLPKAHTLVGAFNAVCRIAAPGLLFEAEALVHPDEVAQYIEPGQCQLASNPLQTALTWEALATRDATLLADALERRHAVPSGTSWVNSVRSHDDLSWTFADEDAAAHGINGPDHRRFLNAFYVGRFPGSFAKGVPFQENPRTGDHRVCGTTASLAGLETGERGAAERILLAYSIALSTGGVPLLYLGDEVGQLNDYGYLDDPDRADDSRWVHRPAYPALRYAERDDPATDAGRIYRGMRHLIGLRRALDELAGTSLVPFPTGDRHVLGYLRPGDEGSLLVLANLSDSPRTLPADLFADLPATAHDVVADITVDLWTGVELEPLQFVWLAV
ncbi:alpha-amylase family glycosyl hydrolase [uncultured Amnibacterium sp.]|uniref:alpha-amylase family glycosyl hydrolase n=1 Tax=uncultured Amnibacterium sp. TaxID=1631851 RepID=UPI0035CBAD5B